MSDSTEVEVLTPAELAEADPHAFDAETEAEEHGHPSQAAYIGIAIILAIFTAMEVSLNYMDAGPSEVPLLLILMTIKFVLVAMYFMHLKFDSPVFMRLFIVGIVLAAAIFSVMLAVQHADL